MSAPGWWKDAAEEKKVRDEGWGGCAVSGVQGEVPKSTVGKRRGIVCGARCCRSHINNSLKHC